LAGKGPGVLFRPSGRFVPGEVSTQWARFRPGRRRAEPLRTSTSIHRRFVGTVLDRRARWRRRARRRRPPPHGARCRVLEGARHTGCKV